MKPPIFAAFLVLTAFFFSLEASAYKPTLEKGPAEKPTLKSGEDTVLVGKDGAKKFFDARKEKMNCRRDLEKARTRWKKANTDLKKLVADKADAKDIDAQSETLLKEKKEFLEFMQECGECATRTTIETRAVREPSYKADWYVSEGSCQLDLPKAEDGKKYLKTIGDSLLDITKYAHYWPGGFADVMEFKLVDHATGAISDKKKIEASPYYAYVVTRGLDLGILIGPSYYIKSPWERDEKKFVLTFETEKAHRNFRAPRVDWVSASGRKRQVRAVPLPGAMGLWYVDDKGYLRYATAADFPGGIEFDVEMAWEILLGTLLAVSERVNPT